MSTNHVFISTTIPYVNARPHIGFALELVQADVTARIARIRGAEVFFQSGTDENSLKNVLAAEAKGRSTLDHVNENAQAFYDLARGLGISINAFVRTASDDHRKSVGRFWSRLNSGDLQTKIYEGSYCVGCEDFIRETDLVSGLCPDHQLKPDRILEQNLFFRLSQYQSELYRLIESDQILICPAFRKPEVLNFISSGLTDISITRPKDRAGGWGIPVPGHPDHVVYVWIDALINYVTGALPDKTSAWLSASNRIQFIEKNVWKFHAVYWPALLLAAGLPLPNQIVIHGFLTENGQKISKSTGGAFDPSTLIREFGTDSVRFFLLRAFSPFDDGDFSKANLQSAHNTYLVNGLGNLVSRLLALADRAKIHRSEIRSASVGFSGLQEFQNRLDQFRFDEALRLLWREFDRINAEIAQSRPWECRSGYRLDIARWLSELRDTNLWLAAFLPGTAEKIEARLSGFSSGLDSELSAGSTDRTHLFVRSR